MRYRAEIDGLRAVAVIPVILFHAGFAAFGGGFVGVDVFFVISGYLITALLLGDLATGRFSIWAFYDRRARRLLPALFVVLAACLPAPGGGCCPATCRSCCRVSPPSRCSCRTSCSGTRAATSTRRPS